MAAAKAIDDFEAALIKDMPLGGGQRGPVVRRTTSRTM